MISVVIPLYNKAHTIERTLGSVLNQTFTNFEVVIVNDGSTDNGVEVIKNFTSDPRIRIINQENQGVSVARNRGVAESKFEYIAFLDGDDEWLPAFLETIIKAIIKYPRAGIYGSSSNHVNYITGVKNDSTILKYKGKIEVVDFFENPLAMSHTSATVVSKKVFYEIFPNGDGFPIGMKVCEDWSCFYRIAFMYSVVYIGIPLGVRYNNVPGQVTSLTSDERYKLLNNVLLFYNLTFQFWLENGKTNNTYLTFLKYDIRHRFLSALRNKEYRIINFLIENFDSSILKQFNKFELTGYQNLKLRMIMMGYIYFTKIIWRLYRYPVVRK